MDLTLSELKKHTQQNEIMIENQNKIIALLEELRPKGVVKSAGNTAPKDSNNRKPRKQRVLS